jgi:hypothetical protein
MKNKNNLYSATKCPKLIQNTSDNSVGKLTGVIANKHYTGDTNKVSTEGIDYYLNLLVPANLHIYLSLSQFNYHRTHRQSRVHCSSFFYLDMPNEETFNREFKVIDNLVEFNFKSLLILDLFDPSISENGYSELPNVKYNNFEIRKVNIKEFFTMDYLEKLSFKDRNNDLSIILHFNGISYASIKSGFKLLNINIGGNNNTMKHVYSPAEYLMGKFISTFFGPNNKCVAKGFFLAKKSRIFAKALYDFSNHEHESLLLNTIREKTLKEYESFIDLPAFKEDRTYLLSQYYKLNSPGFFDIPQRGQKKVLSKLRAKRNKNTSFSSSSENQNYTTQRSTNSLPTSFNKLNEVSKPVITECKITGFRVKQALSSFNQSKKYYHTSTSNPQVGDKGLGKTNLKSYYTYSRNLIEDGASSKLNNNIFLKRAIYNFIKASINNLIPGVHFQDSTALITFLREFDPGFKMSRQSVYNYRKRKVIFKSFLMNPDVSRFFTYVKSRFPEFNPSAFLEKCSGACNPIRNKTGHAGLLKSGFAKSFS